MDYKKTLIDSFDNVHPRKNKYLIDIIESDGSKKRDVIRNRNQHPHIVALKEYKKAKKTFEKQLKANYTNPHKATDSALIAKLRWQYHEAMESVLFYNDYKDLTYDAKMTYEMSRMKRHQIPYILNKYEMLKADLADRKAQLANLDENKRQAAKAEIQRKTQERKAVLDKALEEIKHNYKTGLISLKAYRNETYMVKRSYKEDVNQYQFLDKKVSLEEDIKNIKHRLNVDIESMANVLQSDLSDLRRKFPIEVEKKNPWTSFLSIPFPGLGQLLNGQTVKAGLFFLGCLFMYFIAIPYALGYGNYQGQGIAGLISLAENGKRLDRSIMFMIEGIIAIILVLFSVLIVVMSFKDARKVEKDMILGVRPKTWFETKQTLSNEGFPYIVSTPGYIVTVFIVLIPIITAILISFTNLDPNHQSKFTWIGLENYKVLFLGQGVAGKAFWLILGWTVVWTLGATSLAIGLGFFLSLIANQDRIKGKGLFRTIFLLPWAVPAFITIMFFSLMVARQGPITELFANVFGISLDVKSSATLTRICLILLQGWLGSAYIFLLSTGVLQGIPSDLYEAAEIDGATGWQRTWKITIPLVLFQTAPLLIGQYTFNFNNFSIIYLFNGGGPFNPSLYGNLAGSTDILISYIYKLTMNSNYQALGAAISIMISVVLMFFSYIGFKNTKAFKES